MPSNPPAFIENIPTYEVREGRMHVSMCGMELVMPVHVFLAGCAKGKAAISEWHASQPERCVIPFRSG